MVSRLLAHPSLHASADAAPSTRSFPCPILYRSEASLCSARFSGSPYRPPATPQSSCMDDYDEGMGRLHPILLQPSPQVAALLYVLLTQVMHLIERHRQSQLLPPSTVQLPGQFPDLEGLCESIETLPSPLLRSHARFSPLAQVSAPAAPTSSMRAPTTSARACAAPFCTLVSAPSSSRSSTPWHRDASFDTVQREGFPPLRADQTLLSPCSNLLFSSPAHIQHFPLLTECSPSAAIACPPASTGPSTTTERLSIRMSLTHSLSQQETEHYPLLLALLPPFHGDSCVAGVAGFYSYSSAHPTTHPGPIPPAATNHISHNDPLCPSCSINSEHSPSAAPLPCRVPLSSLPDYLFGDTFNVYIENFGLKTLDLIGLNLVGKHIFISSIHHGISFLTLQANVPVRWLSGWASRLLRRGRGFNPWQQHVGTCKIPEIVVCGCGHRLTILAVMTAVQPSCKPLFLWDKGVPWVLCPSLYSCNFKVKVRGSRPWLNLHLKKKNFTGQSIHESLFLLLFHVYPVTGHMKIYFEPPNLELRTRPFERDFTLCRFPTADVDREFFLGVWRITNFFFDKLVIFAENAHQIAHNKYTPDWDNPLSYNCSLPQMLYYLFLFMDDALLFQGHLSGIPAFLQILKVTDNFFVLFLQQTSMYHVPFDPEILKCCISQLEGGEMVTYTSLSYANSRMRAHKMESSSQQHILTVRRKILKQNLRNMQHQSTA